MEKNGLLKKIFNGSEIDEGFERFKNRVENQLNYGQDREDNFMLFLDSNLKRMKQRNDTVSDERLIQFRNYGITQFISLQETRLKAGASTTTNNIWRNFRAIDMLKKGVSDFTERYKTVVREVVFDIVDSNKNDPENRDDSKARVKLHHLLKANQYVKSSNYFTPEEQENIQSQVQTDIYKYIIKNCSNGNIGNLFEFIDRILDKYEDIATFFDKNILFNVERGYEGLINLPDDNLKNLNKYTNQFVYLSKLTNYNTPDDINKSAENKVGSYVNHRLSSGRKLGSNDLKASNIIVFRCGGFGG